MDNEELKRRRRAVDQEQVEGYRVDISYKSGKEESIQARELDIELEAIDNPSALQKFTYTNSVGEQSSIYLTPDEVAGISLHPTVLYIR